MRFSRTIVISDIHGSFYTFQKLLKDINFNVEKDKLIILGDMCDRGKNSKLVFDFCYKLQKQHKHHIVTLGNHEDMFLWATRTAKFDKKMAPKRIAHYFRNGGLTTLQNFYKEANEENATYYFRRFSIDYKYLWHWLRALPLRHEDENYYYVHAGVDFSKYFYDQTRRDLIWMREPFLSSNFGYNKKIIHGHTPKLTEPYYDVTNTRIAIDGGCVYGGRLNALIILKDASFKIIQQECLVEDKL